MEGQIESLGSFSSLVASALEQLSKEQLTQKLWEKDLSLWKAGPEQQRVIKNSLGWLTVVGLMRDHVGDLSGFADGIRQKGFTHAVLLGMGGSSLCVEVLRQSFGTVAGYPDLSVLDSTDLATILSIEHKINLDKTLFIVASKSGTTTEVSSFYKYFFEKVRPLRGDQAGEHFIAITDPGTALEKIAREKNFLRIFANPADIGGRYSALSFFGLAPAAIMGLEVGPLLDRADDMVEACSSSVPIESNPGVRLGVVLSELAKAGRDKITFIASPGIATFGLWTEQLLAESTGKEGRGLVPVEGEPLGELNVYGKDRLFVYLRLRSAPSLEQDKFVGSLEKAEQPMIKFLLKDKLDLGAEFFRWETATAVAGALMNINPFDQPNVQESKDNTNRILAEFRQAGKLPQDSPIATQGDLSLFCDAATRKSLEKLISPARPTQSALGSGSGLNLSSYFSAHLSQTRPGDYLALTAYLQPSPNNHAKLQTLRQHLRAKLRVATTLGYGPRFLHSTGQLHKGGANNGVFIQITADDSSDLPILGEPYSFSILKQAQALGDYQSLVSKKRRVVRLHLAKEVEAGLEQLVKLVKDEE